MVFAETYRKNGAPYPLTPVMTGVWVKLLSDLDADVLNAACRKLAAVGCRREFPIPADVRAQIEQANEKGFELEAEHAWRHALDWIGRWYHPDVEISRSAPELSPEITHAIRAAGGMHMLFSCPEADLVWRKRDFVVDYSRTEELGRSEQLLADGEAKRFLAMLTAKAPQPERRQLAPARKAPAVHAERTFLRMGSESVLPQERKPVNPIIEITDEVRERIEAQKKALREKFPEQFRKAEGPTPKEVLA